MVNWEKFYQQLKPVLAKLPKSGELSLIHANYLFLSVDDEYIHQIFPLIPIDGLNKPEYFNANLNHMGAHISIIYPEEGIKHVDEQLGRKISFETVAFFNVKIKTKEYYVLKVSAPELLAIRRKYHLSEKLKLKDQWLDLHITIGTKNH